MIRRKNAVLAGPRQGRHLSKNGPLFAVGKKIYRTELYSHEDREGPEQVLRKELQRKGARVGKGQEVHHDGTEH